MFNRIKLRINDIKTINQLIPNAEAQANALGEDAAGAEHYVLSALELKDGSAKRVFAALNINAQDYQDAINRQYDQALNSIGIDAESVAVEPIINQKILLGAHPSGKQLIKSLHALKKNDKDKPLLARIIHETASVARRELISQGIFFSRRILIDICKRENSLWNQGSSGMPSLF